MLTWFNATSADKFSLCLVGGATGLAVVIGQDADDVTPADQWRLCLVGGALGWLL